MQSAGVPSSPSVTITLLTLRLAGVGIYAVLAYSLRQRTPEIGIRKAMGTERAKALLMVKCRGLMPAALGLTAGLGIASVLSQTLAGLFYGINATDPTTHFSVCLFMLSIAAVAAYIPARRATRADPVVPLRDE
jgi:putative ABC transport system permease protein